MIKPYLVSILVEIAFQPKDLDVLLISLVNCISYLSMINIDVILQYWYH